MNTKTIISKDQEERMNIICKRANNSITPIQIRNWLENFQSGELEIALNVIESIKYFSIDNIICEYDKFLSEILNKYYLDRKLFLLGIGKFGKSGSAMIYFVKQTPTYKKNHQKFEILDTPKGLLNHGVMRGDSLVMIDDIIGTGESFRGYYNDEIRNQCVEHNLDISAIVLCIAYMRQSVKYITEYFPHVIFYGTEYLKAFSSGPSVFGYRAKMLPVRQLCYHYGKCKDLFSMMNFKTGVREFHPLGYKGSQSLIVFAHSVPNNTLPIIWSTKNGWTPLYPRDSTTRLSRLKEFNKEVWLWLSIAKKIGLINKQDNLENFHNEDFDLLALIKLKKQKRIIPVICQILGITFNDYREIIKKGNERGIFDENENLTLSGSKFYENIIKKIRYPVKESFNEERNFIDKTQYIPKKFLGKT